MKNDIKARIMVLSQVAVLALASAFAIPAMAQQTQQPGLAAIARLATIGARI